MATIITVAALAATIVQLVTASPLMDTLLQIPDLSTYAEVYNLTGGIVEINPLFLKRYNYDEDKRNYTFLAPTNNVRFFHPPCQPIAERHLTSQTHRHGPRFPTLSLISI